MNDLSIGGREPLAAGNREEYGEKYAALRFPSSAEAESALRRRAQLLAAVADRAETGARGSKLDCRTLSPGCRLCLEGVWSCLFVNGRCNARCFYCPAPQDEMGDPTTNTLRFPSPPDYLDYLERFGFRGVSLSGGEPLLTPEKTLQFIAAVKRRFGTSVHLWLYTNGLLLTGELARKLRDAGLDEIRFDLGANAYRLDPVRLAAGLIEHVTVEIPAVPEEGERLKGMMAEMAEAGVRYLNLHQLRLTPHNYPHLAKRGYTFLHGEKVTVLESELTALELLRHSLDEKIPLGVNYCSFVYKNRYQRLAARQRYIPLVRKGWEDTTENGYLRALSLVGDADPLRRQSDAFAASGAPRESWDLSGDRLSFAAALWPHLRPGSASLRVRYTEAALVPSVTYRFPFTTVPLNRNRKVVVERRPAGEELEISGEFREAFGRFLAGAGGNLPAEMLRREMIPEGLQEYW